jgi:hypothetical protein
MVRRVRKFLRHVAALRPVLFLLAVLGCLSTPVLSADRTSFDARLDRWLEDLRSERPQSRAAAFRNLCQLPPWRLTPDRSIRMLRCATQELPAIKQPAVHWTFQDLSPNECLIRIAATRSRPEQIPVVVECFEKYSPEARAESLQLLTGLQSREAAEATMQLIRKFAAKGGIRSLSLWGWHEETDIADVFFPGLFQFVDRPDFEGDILALLESYVEVPEATDKIGKLCGAELLARYRTHLKQILPAQRKHNDAIFYSADYQLHRRPLHTTLRLFAKFRSTESDEELRQATYLFDPRLKQAAAIALLQRGDTPEAKVWEEIAASAETRVSLVDDLLEANRTELFPAKYLTQALLAESELVRWLVDESEVGAAPANIELVKVVTLDPRTEDGLLDFYIFKFCMEPKNRQDPAAWKAGVSGPYLRDDQPTSSGEDSPHSEFLPIDEKFPESHIGDIQEILRSYRLRAGLED